MVTTVINQSINQSWIYIAHKRKAYNALQNNKKVQNNRSKLSFKNKNFA